MADYYTSEYSPVLNRYQSPTVAAKPLGDDLAASQGLGPLGSEPQTLPTRQVSVQRPQIRVSVQPPNQQYTYNQNSFNLNFKEILKRAIKYLVEGLAVAFVAYYFVGKGKLNIQDIVLLGITAAFVFAILDTFSPTVALGVRFGAGFGIGQGLFGVGPGLIAGPIRPI